VDAHPGARIGEHAGCARLKGTMNDNDVHSHIEALVAEEHRLFADAERQGPETPEDRLRLEEIRVELDRYWDLLRQRRAQREFGRNPDEAERRPGETVEHYLQ
jgi:hypothetical protein